MTAAPPVIDFHIHMQPWETMKPQVLEHMRRGRPEFHHLLELARSPEAFLRYLDRAGIERAGIINYTSPDLMGFTEETNAFSGRFCRGAPDRLLAFGSVHPRFTRDPEGDVERLLDLGVRALKIHPPHQLVAANAYRGPSGGQGPFPALAKIYQRAQDLGMPVAIHTGTSVFPGARSALGHPLAIDDVAVDFPDLTILLSHCGRPLWSDVCFFLARRHPNVYLELSGIPPHRLLATLPRLGELAHKAIWGTDWPGPGVPEPHRNLAAFQALSLSGEAKSAILYGNARRLWERLPSRT
ncbi:MAG: amidohydrolase family protein [Acidobacteriota bacterium]